MNSTGSSLILLLVLVLLQAILTAMYYALSNTRKAYLRELAEDGNIVARRTLILAESATSLLTSQQYVSLFLSICSTAVLVRYVLPGFENGLIEMGIQNRLATFLVFVVALPFFALLVLLLGHQVPSAVISGRADHFAMMVSSPMSVLINGLAPILVFIQPISQWIGRLMGGSGTVTFVTQEEIKTLVDAGSEEGVIEDEEKEMIYSVFRFSDTLAREVMVPRIDVEALDIDTALEEAMDVIIKVGHSRIPVFEESIDDIKGLLYAKDLMALWRNGTHTSTRLKDILREAYFIPESKKAGDLLTEMQARKIHLAIVIDEYGGTAGLVTIEDLLEEIVGEIRDEYDVYEEEPYEKISETEYICLAGLDLDDLNDLLDIDLPTDENDTLGGYIFTALGEVPEVGDKVNEHGVEMEVLTLDGRRIHKVRVKKLDKEPVIEEDTEVEATPAEDTPVANSETVKSDDTPTA